VAYEYDVFVSYVTRFPSGDWVHEIFLPLFKPYLENALNRDVNLFVDKHEISSGDAWPERIKKALAHSKCLVALWLPSYFNSIWCLCECAVMLHRERQLNYQTIENPSGLIIPINLFDGEHFPDFAQQIQYLDCRNFFRVGSGFLKTERYVEFQDVLIEWIDDVANAVNNAPPWSEEWQARQWLDDPIENIHRIAIPGFEPPALG